MGKVFDPLLLFGKLKKSTTAALALKADASQLAAKLTYWEGTQSEYNALTPDAGTFYKITDDASAPMYADLLFEGKSVLTTDWVSDNTYVALDHAPAYRADVVCAGVSARWEPTVLYGAVEYSNGNHLGPHISGTNKVSLYATAVPAGTITVSIRCKYWGAGT